MGVGDQEHELAPLLARGVEGGADDGVAQSAAASLLERPDVVDLGDPLDVAVQTAGGERVLRGVGVRLLTEAQLVKV